MIIKNFSNIQLLAESDSGAKQIPEGTSKFSALLESEVLNAVKQNPVSLFLSTNNGIDKSSLISQERQSASVIVATFTASQPPETAWLMRQDFNPDVNLPGYLSGENGIGPISNSLSVGEHYLYTLEGQESTQENPIMYVLSYNKNVEYWCKISINEVNPRNATREEMFAYITYMYKDDGDALYCATRNFEAIDEHGQERRDYVTAFQAYADICKGYLASADYAEHMKNMPVGARDYTQMAFDMLLEMLDNMIERSERFTEHEEHTDIDEPEEMVDTIKGDVERPE